MLNFPHHCRYLTFPKILRFLSPLRLVNLPSTRRSVTTIFMPCDPKEELIKTLAEQVLRGCESGVSSTKQQVGSNANMTLMLILILLHTYTHTHIYIYIKDNIHIYIYISLCLSLSLYLSLCIYNYMYIYVYMHICIYGYMYICIYVYMYICIYVYMYIFTHDRVFSVQCSLLPVPVGSFFLHLV